MAQQSVRNIITGINESLEGIFKGGKFYGVATLVEREAKGQPVVEGLPVAYDDSYPMQMYHRLGNVSIAYTPGYGDTMTTTNTYQVSAIVFNNETITKLKTDEIAMIIQSLLALNNSATLNGIILNSQTVFAQEYKGVPYSLNEYQSLMQINYTVEITFKGNCFDLCPEDFLKCKN